MGKMRVGLVAVIILAGLFVSESTNPDHDCDPSVKQQSKQREVRGFKPRNLATAIDFGKKRDLSSQDRSTKGLMLLLQNCRRSAAIRWLVHEMKKKPAFARKMLGKIFAEEWSGSNWD